MKLKIEIDKFKFRMQIKVNKTIIIYLNGKKYLFGPTSTKPVLSPLNNLSISFVFSSGRRSYFRDCWAILTVCFPING